MNMIRLDPDLARATRWAAAEALGRDEDYTWHAILKAAFGEHAPKPFRVMERQGRPAQLLGYTSADLETLMTHTQTFADPAVTEALRLNTLALKKLPDFEAGMRLGFEVRVRPIVRQTKDDGTRERDAFLVALERRKVETGSDAVTLDRQEVYCDWVTEQLAKGGARTISVACQALRMRKADRRKSNRSFGRIDGPDVVVKGAIMVENAKAFASMMARGVGRHRSFGFGMILLRPARGE